MTDITVNEPHKPVTRLIYEAAGLAQHGGVGPVLGKCRACGMYETGVEFGDWVKTTFTDWNLLQPGAIVCDACLFCFNEASTEVAARTGKDAPQRFRNYSHFVTQDGVWVPCTKGQKPAMLNILLHAPRVAVIADSGQKHIVFRAKPGWWQFEETAMRPNPIILRPLVEAIIPALSVFSKAEIESGRYDQRRIIQFGVVRFDCLETGLKRYRGSPVFALALWLAQKEEEEDGSE